MPADTAEMSLVAGHRVTRLLELCGARDHLPCADRRPASGRANGPRWTTASRRTRAMWRSCLGRMLHHLRYSEQRPFCGGLRAEWVGRQHLRCGLFAVSFLSRRKASLRGRRGTEAGMATDNGFPQDRPDSGALSAAISQAIVQLMAESTGRGPTKARTTIDRDLIVVLLQNGLTPGERYLAESNRGEQVLEMRRAYQDAMSSDCVAAIEGLTGRTVLAFMSANHIDPDLAAETFVLKPDTNRT
jgi:uncharacterized protein YbcI